MTLRYRSPPVSLRRRTHGHGCGDRICECHIDINCAPKQRPFQQKEQLKEAIRSKKQRGEDRALQDVIEALGVPPEGDSDRYQLQDSTNESSDESSEEECEITDGGGYRHL